MRVTLKVETAEETNSTDMMRRWMVVMMTGAVEFQCCQVNVPVSRLG